MDHQEVKDVVAERYDGLKVEEENRGGGKGVVGWVKKIPVVNMLRKMVYLYQQLWPSHDQQKTCIVCISMQIGKNEI